MIARDAIAFNLGRDTAHSEYQWPSQREAATVLSVRLAQAAVERFLVRAYAREREGGCL